MKLTVRVDPFHELAMGLSHLCHDHIRVFNNENPLRLGVIFTRNLRDLCGVFFRFREASRHVLLERRGRLPDRCHRFLSEGS